MDERSNTNTGLAYPACAAGYGDDFWIHRRHVNLENQRSDYQNRDDRPHPGRRWVTASSDPNDDNLGLWRPPSRR